MSVSVGAIELLVSDLTATLTTTKLPAHFKATIKLAPNDIPVACSTTNILEAVARMLICIVLNEAESTWHLCLAIEAHDDSLYWSYTREDLMDL
jgi:hypothetical protein